MLALTSSDLLQLAACGRSYGSVERALLLLERAWPESTTEERAALPLGWRDALVMALRAHTFGTRAPLAASCPACGQDLEAELNLAQVLAAHPGGEPPVGGEFEVAGRALPFRLATSADLLALAAAAPPPEEAAGFLRRRLLTAGEDLPPEASPEAFTTALAAADPLADVRLDLACGACGAVAPQSFDVVSFFWAEIEAAARRVVWEIHTLASAYGWTEGEILNLDPGRRALYLEMVQS